MSPINVLLLGLLGVVGVVIIFYLVKLFRIDPAKYAALKPREQEIRLEKPEKGEEKQEHEGKPPVPAE